MRWREFWPNVASRLNVRLCCSREAPTSPPPLAALATDFSLFLFGLLFLVSTTQQFSHIKSEKTDVIQTFRPYCCCRACLVHVGKGKETLTVKFKVVFAGQDLVLDIFFRISCRLFLSGLLQIALMLQAMWIIFLRLFYDCQLCDKLLLLLQYKQQQPHP